MGLTMNPKSMLIDLNRLVEQWERDSKTVEIADKPEWGRGVVHGIRAGSDYVKRVSTHSPRTLLEGLNALTVRWERNLGNPDMAAKTEWLRGVVYGVKQATYTVARHLDPLPFGQG